MDWPPCLNFRLIIAKISSVQKFRNFMVIQVKVSVMALMSIVLSFLRWNKITLLLRAFNCLFLFLVIDV